MGSRPARKIAVALGVGAAVLIPAVQMGLHLGLSQAAFAAQGDGTLRAAGYAFSIWGLIYLGLMAFAVHHARAPDSPALQALAWPAAVASFGCGLWIVAAAANARWATVAVICVSLIAALFALLKAAPLARGRDRLLGLVPVALLAGWLIVAAPLNLLTVLTATELMPPHAIGISALVGLGVILSLTAVILRKTRTWSCALPVVWGLIGIYVGEREPKPIVASAAAAAALGLLIGTAIVALGRRRA